MKKNHFITLLAVCCLFVTSAIAQDTYYGDKITDEGAVSVTALTRSMEGKTEMQAKVEGVVLEVCQTKGCWMTMEKGDGTKMRVTFKDYGFFVPKDISGKTVVIEGIAKVKTTTVEELQHYAEDAGKSKEEIAKITTPKSELTFEASGVIVRK
jgi:Domain of unknown function (DUF4920)